MFTMKNREDNFVGLLILAGAILFFGFTSSSGRFNPFSLAGATAGPGNREEDQEKKYRLLYSRTLGQESRSVGEETKPFRVLYTRSLGPESSIPTN